MAVTNYYTVNGVLIGEKTAGGSRTDYLTDALGSVTATVNQSGYESALRRGVYR